MSAPQQAPLALYIHWPFCVSKCPYCDFNSHVRDGIDEEAWLAALLADMAHEAQMTAGRPLRSIFFGGGTPSLMPPRLVASLIEAAGRHWQLDADAEITLEANPNSTEAARFADLASAGVNRVSLGLQALDDATLAFLGRAHSVDEGLRALDTAQARFRRVNFDLIYARPHQSAEQWAAELARALSFGTDHLSLYQLTIEPGTRFETMVRRGDFIPLDADEAASLYELTQDMAAAAGIPAYEVSNHARPGQESRHNLAYWRYDDYLGIGPGAHGRRLERATVRHKKPENWMAAIHADGHGIVSEEQLPRADQAREALLMGLRLFSGLDIGALASRLGFDSAQLVDWAAIDRIGQIGLLNRQDRQVIVNRRGMLLLDAILGDIVLI